MKKILFPYRRSSQKILFVILPAILLFSSARAEVVEVPQEELALESVLPKFDRPDSVRNRNIVTEKKIELGVYLGWNTLEPIRSQNKYGFNLGYHWSETSAFVLNYAKWASGLNTQYTNDLSASPNNLDFERSPAINYSVFGHYEWKVFYGKISVTKQGVVNLSTYPILGLGMTAYEHKNYYGFDGGIGQKFYFSKNSALRADFKLQYSQYPSPFLKGRMQKSQPTPTGSDFKDKWGLGTIIDIGYSFLF